MNTIAITGGTGFIGSHLVKQLESNNIPFVNFTGNLLDEAKVVEFLQKNKIEQVIHLVGSFDLPFKNLLEKNVLVTQTLLEACVKTGVKKVIYASTGAVYGDPKRDRSYEEDPLEPTTLYGLAKKMAEDCVTYYARNYHMTAIILRFPNVYGEGNKKGAIYYFLHDIKTKGSLTIEGDGEQIRNFLHVSDACGAIEKTLVYSHSNIFNISTGKDMTINDVVEQLKEKYQFIVTYQKANIDHQRNLSLDIEKANKELQFSPIVTKLQI